jgi:uncharacterized membrane protein
LGGSEEIAYFVSDDSLTVIGLAKNVSAVNVPFVWTEETGMTAIAGFNITTTLNSCNNDCTVFSGRDAGGPFIWRDGVGASYYVFGGTQSSIYDTSEDGSIGVGSTFIGGSSKIIIKNADDSITNLGNGAAFCCSSDGLTIFGVSGVAPTWIPFRYTVETGIVLLTGTSSGDVRSCSDDGNFCAGYYDVGGSDVPFRWGATTGLELFDILGELAAYTVNAPSISRDGNAVFGYARGTYYTWYVWEPDYNLTDIESGSGTQNSFVGVSPVISGNGRVVTVSLLIDNADFTQVKWDRDTGIFRSLAPLEDRFFDFAQSTL